jgi:hypothetical protein
VASLLLDILNRFLDFALDDQTIYSTSRSTPRPATVVQVDNIILRREQAHSLTVFRPTKEGEKSP